MPKYLLLKQYTGGPEGHPNFVPMSEWTEDEITAHIAFQRHVGELLRKRGEFVDAQALSPEGTYVRYGGPGAAPVTTDGPSICHEVPAGLSRRSPARYSAQRRQSVISTASIRRPSGGTGRPWACQAHTEPADLHTRPITSPSKATVHAVPALLKPSAGSQLAQVQTKVRGTC